jgi:3'-phosphoadenosine 5'-phosphosulfate sulfotransferase (PAPS reductase)/FAD synthetase
MPSPKLRGVDAWDATILYANGIKTSLQLLVAARTTRTRFVISKNTGIPAKKLKKYIDFYKKSMKNVRKIHRTDDPQLELFTMEDLGKRSRRKRFTTGDA